MPALRASQLRLVPASGALRHRLGLCWPSGPKKTSDDWNNDKNSELKQTRNVCFEQVVLHIGQGDLLDPNKAQYPNQRVLVVKIIDYLYAVPFVEEGNSRFLKTIIPSRKLTRDYLENEDE